MLLRDPKRLLAVMIAGVAGLIVLIDFAGAGGMFSPLARLLVDWAAVITAVGLLLGILSVVGSHVQRVRKRSADWPYSVVLILGMLTMIVAGIFFPVSGRGIERAHIAALALEFPQWGTRRLPWRAGAVAITGDAELGARVLDSINLV